jgi:hypothetical protein
MGVALASIKGGFKQDTGIDAADDSRERGLAGRGILDRGGEGAARESPPATHPRNNRRDSIDRPKLT